MMRLTKRLTLREKILLLVLAFLLLGVGYFKLVHEPVQSSMTQAEQQLQEEQTRQMVLQAKQTRLSQMRAELDELLANGGAVAPTPKYDNQLQVMMTLNSILQSASDYSLSFEPVVTDAEAGIVRRPITMSFTAFSYDAALSIITALHDAPYRCQLGNIMLGSKQREEDKGKEWKGNIESDAISAQLTITFFESID